MQTNGCIVNGELLLSKTQGVCLPNTHDWIELSLFSWAVWIESWLLEGEFYQKGWLKIQKYIACAKEKQFALQMENVKANAKTKVSENFNWAFNIITNLQDMMSNHL